MLFTRVYGICSKSQLEMIGAKTMDGLHMMEVRNASKKAHFKKAPKRPALQNVKIVIFFSQIDASSHNVTKKKKGQKKERKVCGKDHEHTTHAHTGTTI